MGGIGPAPKLNHQRAYDDHDIEPLPYTDALYGMPLPEGVLPDGGDWHPQTLALWESLRSNPLLADEPPLGWQLLIDTALLHHIMWTEERFALAAEVRLRVAKFGATPEDRMRLKLKIVAPKANALPSAGTVRGINSRRARLTED